MNAKQAKATRRDIRRSFGADAFDEIVQMADLLNRTVETVGDVRGLVATVDSAHHANHAAVLEAVRAHTDRSFLGRLRWLFLGR
jgi:selenocysteine lyase/cysteine desulfurase